MRVISFTLRRTGNTQKITNKLTIQMNFLLHITIIVLANVIIVSTIVDFADDLRCGCPYNTAHLKSCSSNLSSPYFYNDSLRLYQGLVPVAAMKATMESCRRLNLSKAFGNLNIIRGAIFVSENGDDMPPNITPFIGAGGFSAIADIVIGRTARDTDIPSINTFRSIVARKNNSIVIHIRQKFGQTFVKRLSTLDILRSCPNVTLIIGHADTGFPSGRLASAVSLEHSRSESRAMMAKVPAHWRIFTSNYDDLHAITAPRVRPIPLGLTTATFVRSQLNFLCSLVQADFSTSETSQKAHTRSKWLFVAAFGNTEVEGKERARAVSAAMRLNESARHPGSVTFASNASFEDTQRASMDHRFVLAPSGRGCDTHRVLEAMMLGCVPVVRWEPYVCAYEGLPVLRVLSWDDLTWQVLEAAWVRITAEGGTSVYRFDRMFMDYWTRSVSRP